MGGNANTYDYCTADPINCTDLDGRFGWKKWAKRALKVATVAAMFSCTLCTIAAAGVAAYGAYQAYGHARRGDWSGSAGAVLGSFGYTKGMRYLRMPYVRSAKKVRNEFRDFDRPDQAVRAALRYSQKHRKRGCVYDGECSLGGHVHARYIRNNEVVRTIHFRWRE